MTRFKMVLAMVVAVATFFAGGWLLRKGLTRVAPPAAVQPTAPGGTRLFTSVLQTIQSYAVDSLDERTIYRLAADGVLSELGDPYAALVADRDTAGPPDQLGPRPVQGLYLDWTEGFVAVVGVVPGSPAATAGVLPGDIVLRVDGTVVTSQRADEVAAMIDGPKGSTVRVRFGRESADGPVWLTITRGPVPELPGPRLDTVESGLVALRLARIDSTAVRLLDQTLTRPGLRGLIIDLRGAVAGTLSDGVAFADLLLSPGQTIATSRRRPATDTTAFVDQRESAAPDLPVVALVDRGTAGAAEVVAGALQDHDRAAVVGETTFGRGARQSYFPLGNGFSLRLMTEVWLTPSGRVIQRVAPASVPEGSTDTLPDRPKFKTDGGRTVLGGGGVVPDREIPLEREPSRDSDPTLAAARQLLARATTRKQLISALDN